MVEAFITPEMIGWAIERVHETHIGLAHKLNVKPEKIAEWVSGDKRPSIRQAQELAKKLKIPFGYLYLSSPPTEKLPLPDLRTMSGTPSSKPSPDFLDVLHDALRKQQWYHEYLKNENVASLPFIGRFKLGDNPKDIAIDIKSTLGINDTLRRQSRTWEEFLTQFSRKAEEARILVLRSGIVGNNTYRKLDVHEFRGFAISDDLAPLVFVNGNDYKSAQIFTLAHELAHLWIGQSGVSNPNYMLRANQQQNEIDRLCDSIAAEVLVPSDDFIMRWNDFSNLDENIDNLAVQYRVSGFVILRRAYTLGKIETDLFHAKYDELLRKSQRRPTNGGGDFYNLLMSRNSNTFTTALMIGVAEGSVAPTEAARLLNLRVARLRHVESYILGRQLANV